MAVSVAYGQMPGERGLVARSCRLWLLIVVVGVLAHVDDSIESESEPKKVMV
jgi:hypothetical protein